MIVVNVYYNEIRFYLHDSIVVTDISKKKTKQKAVKAKIILKNPRWKRKTIKKKGYLQFHFLKDIRKMASRLSLFKESRQ